MTNATGSSQSELNVVLAGNVASDVDAFHNPYGPSGTVSSFYYSLNNTTTFSFSGTGIGDSSPATVGLSDTVADQIIGTYWGGARTNPAPLAFQLAAPTIATKTAFGGGSTEYLIFFADFRFTGGPTAGDWYEQPVTIGESVEFQLFNNDNANQPLFISNARYFISDTLIPLDNLNNTDEPPAGSNFAAVPGITDGTEITPGTHLEAGNISVPEPSTTALLVTGIPMLLAWRKRKVRKA